MKRSKFSEDQIAYALKQNELGSTVEEVCRKMGISDATFYLWKKKYRRIHVMLRREGRIYPNERQRQAGAPTLP